MKLHYIILALVSGCGLAGATSKTSASADKPDRLYIANYVDVENGTMVSTVKYYNADGSSAGGGTENRSDIIAGGWQDLIGGVADYSQKDIISGSTGNFTSSAWVDGYFEPTLYPDVLYDFTDASSDDPTCPINVHGEHCDIGVPEADSTGAGTFPTDGVGDYVTVVEKDTGQRYAQAVMKLQTGGRSGSKLQNLFGFNGSATPGMCMKMPIPEYLNDPPPPVPPPIPRQSIYINNVGYLPAIGTKYKVLPDDTTIDVTPQVQGNDFFSFDLSESKYHCYFIAFAKEPNPGAGRNSIIDWGHLTGGHAWWSLNSNAPIDGLFKAGISTGSLRFLNQQVGYFPAISSYFSSSVPVVGELRDPGNGDRIDGQFTWDVGFNSLKGGLDFTANLASNPGLYSLWAWPHTCVTTTIQAGAAAGITLPSDTTPQDLGIDLNAM